MPKAAKKADSIHGSNEIAFSPKQAGVSATALDHIHNRKDAHRMQRGATGSARLFKFTKPDTSGIDEAEVAIKEASSQEELDAAAAAATALMQEKSARQRVSRLKSEEVKAHLMQLYTQKKTEMSEEEALEQAHHEAHVKWLDTSRSARMKAQEWRLFRP